MSDGTMRLTRCRKSRWEGMAASDDIERNPNFHLVTSECPWCENELLKSQLAEVKEIAEKLVEFYGLKNSWNILHVERHEYSIIDELDREKLPTAIDDGKGVWFGGKLAREMKARLEKLK